MNKNLMYIAVGIIIGLLLVVFVPKYLSVGNNIEDINSINVTGKTIEKIEVIHFHGTHQCDSCITVGNLAEEAINESFQNELKSGKITFQHLNAESPENSEIVAKYGVKSASLWMGIYTEDGFYPEEVVDVWYKIDNPTEYKNYLTDLLNKRLNGDLN